VFVETSVSTYNPFSTEKTTMSNGAVSFTSLPNNYVLARGAKVVYEPSIFGGTGGEQRVNMVLTVSEDTRTQLTDIENSMPLGNTLCSVVKDDGNIRVKLDNDAVRIFDQEHKLTQPPPHWKGATINALLEIRGHWKSRSGAGLSVICTDIQLASEAAPVVSPFLA